MWVSYAPYGFYIPAEENEIPVLAAEHPGVFRELMQDILAQQGGDIGELAVFDGDEEVRLRTEAELIFNPFDLSANEKTLAARLITRAKALAVSETHYLAWRALANELERFCCRLGEDFSFPVETAEPDPAAVLKAAGLRCVSGGDSIPEQLLNYMAAASELLSPRLFIFVNLRGCLTEEEAAAFYREAAYRKYSLFLLENCGRSPIAGEKWVVIDNDRCVIPLFPEEP